MPPTFRKSGRDCWVDVYDTTYFGGKLRRYFGPIELRRLTGGSVIVGPQAKLQVIARRGQKPVLIDLKPNKIIPDLAASLRGAEIQSARVDLPMA
jgi:hypothetical protein